MRATRRLSAPLPCFWQRPVLGVRRAAHPTSLSAMRWTRPYLFSPLYHFSSFLQDYSHGSIVQSLQHLCLPSLLPPTPPPPPLPSVLRIWDVMMYEGNRCMLFRASLALIEMHCKSIPVVWGKP